MRVKNTTGKRFITVLFFLGSFYMGIGSASAHRVNVFAWVEGDTVHVESKFAGGKKVKAGKIVVMDSLGNRLLSGLTNDQGDFSFKVPKRTDLRIVLIAGQGHQGEWIIGEDEMEESSSKTAPDTSIEKSMQSQGQKADPITSLDFGTAKPDNAINPKELEALIEKVLDRKLKPITRMLSDIRQDAPSFRDIFAGIGYILGLVGIAAYVHSRRKKE